jgi:predicted ATPase
VAKIEGIKIKNFRSLRDISLGVSDVSQVPLTPLTVVLGKNGVGKSSLFDAFGFLADALKYGVEDACELRGRGGFQKLRSQGQQGFIEFQIVYRQKETSPVIDYIVQFNEDDSGRPFVEYEALFYHDVNSEYVGFLCAFDTFAFVLNEQKNGFDLGQVLKIIETTAENFKRTPATKLDMAELFKWTANQMGAVEGAEIVELVDNRKLAIASLGALKQHPEIAAFREFIESWYLSYFSPEAARTLPLSGASHHLNSKGDNLANVVQFMEREHKEKFQDILNRISEKIPGIASIKTYRDPISNQLHLLFQDKGFDKPFYAPQMSDGTLKIFAYLLLLEDPTPPPFICIEEPENGLYHKLLEVLATEFRTHATGRDGSSQLFITTHQPYFVDALEPEEVWVLEKGEDGFSTITRASEIPFVKNMVNEGLALGGLWYSDYLDPK